MNEKLAKALLQWRTKEGLTQEAAAKKIGCDPKMYKRYESCTTYPRPKTLSKINRVLGANFEPIKAFDVRKDAAIIATIERAMKMANGYIDPKESGVAIVLRDGAIARYFRAAMNINVMVAKGAIERRHADKMLHTLRTSLLRAEGGDEE